MGHPVAAPGGVDGSGLVGGLPDVDVDAARQREWLIEIVDDMADLGVDDFGGECPRDVGQVSPLARLGGSLGHVHA